MNATVNDILSIFVQTGYELQSNLKLKVKGGRKLISLEEFYKNNVSSLSSISFSNLEALCKEINLKKEQEKPADFSTFDSLLKSCWFIYEKFRWNVTQKRIKVFYERVNYDYTQNKYHTNEYFNLGSDKESTIFFDSICGNPHELANLQRLVDEYNIVNAGVEKFEKTTPEKVVKAIVSDVRQRVEYSIPKEPVVLTNDPTEAAYKFFDVAIRLKSGDDYVAARRAQNPDLGWEYLRPPTPAWDEFFARVTNQDMVPVIKAFIAGIFLGKTESKQILYLYGEGDDGKSEIIKIIMKFLGDELVFTLDQHLHMNQFSSFDAVGKRLCIGEELNAPNALKHKAIKALSGSSPIRVEPKGEKAFTIEPRVSIILTSNEHAKIGDQRNQLSRLIFVSLESCDFERANKHGSSWKKALKEEFEALLYDGLKQYEKINPEGKSYMLPASHTNDVKHLYDEETNYLDEFFQSCFEECPKSYMRSKLNNAFIMYLGRENEDRKNDLMNEYKRLNENRLYAALKKKFPNISRGEREYFDDCQFRAIKGLKLKSTGSYLEIILDVKTSI